MASSINAEDWSVDSVEAMSLSLHDPKTGDAVESDIPPVFTYPLYGESQAIYGYKGLKIRILFAADDMEPCVDINFDQQAPVIGEVKPEDVAHPLKEVMPECPSPISPPQTPD